MKNKIYTTFMLIGALYISVFAGNLLRKGYVHFFMKDQNRLVDVLPLQDENQVQVEIINGERVISMDYKTMQYLSKSKKYMVDATKKTDQLFLRLEDK